MKWEKLQADMLTKHIITDKALQCYASPQGYVEIAYKYWVMRVPIFFMHLHIPDVMITGNSYISGYAKQNADDFKELRPSRVELSGKIPVQIFTNDATGEEIRVNTRYYTPYTEKADEITFWGLDRKSPVLAVNGPDFDLDNIVFMVLPIKYN